MSNIIDVRILPEITRATDLPAPTEWNRCEGIKDLQALAELNWRKQEKMAWNAQTPDLRNQAGNERRHQMRRGRTMKARASSCQIMKRTYENEFINILWTLCILYILLFNHGNTKERGWVKLTPSGFFKLSPKPPGIFRKKKFVLKAPICDILVVGSILKVDPTQIYWENTKRPIQEFHEFRYKNLLQFIFWIISHKYLLYSYIIVWFYNIFMILNWIREKNLQNSLKISVFFQIFSFQDRRLFTFNVITLLTFDLKQQSCHHNIPQESL